MKIRLLILISILLNIGCSKDESILPIKHIDVIYPTGGLGDQAYVDNIFKGVVSAKYEHSFLLNHIFPNNQTSSINIIDSILSIESKSKNLLILADGTYGDIIDNSKLYVNDKNILLLDGKSEKDIWTINFSFYGAAYLAGVAAAEVSACDSVAFIAGMPLPTLINCYNGFKDGFISNDGVYVGIHFLHTTPLGFEMMHEAEELTKKLLENTDLVVGAAGGSNIGIFNVIRQKTKKYAIGIDADQSHFAPDAIIGSIFKDVESVLMKSISDIENNGYSPKSEFFDLKSGYTDFVINARFIDLLEDCVEESRNEAIINEEKILNNNL